jgi:hypothetical protein
MSALVLRHLWPVLVLPLAGCTSAPILWVAVALAIYGVIVGMYPER